MSLSMSLGRASLRRVLESKLRAEIAASRGGLRRGAEGSATLPLSGLPPSGLPASPWPESLRLFGEGPEAERLDCDSLERLWLAGAVNEMFHIHETGIEDYLVVRPSLGEWLDILEASWGARPERLTFTTSGSTGAPKRCTHLVTDLVEEVEALATLLPGRGRIVSTVPAHHIYGILFTAFLAEHLELPVWDAAAVGPGALAGALRCDDLLVSFPDRWRYLEQSIPRFPDGLIGTTSTAPCPAWLIDRLVQKGMAAVIEIYGSSETGGIGTRTRPDEPYTLLPYWAPVRPADGTAGAVRLARTSGREVTTMDHLDFCDARRFTVAGRADAAVQVGGLNVFPERIAERLRTHPAVTDAAVRLMRPDEGTRLKAFIVLAPGVPEEDVRPTIARWIEAEFAAVERPKALTFGSALPRTGMAKAGDW